MPRKRERKRAAKKDRRGVPGPGWWQEPRRHREAAYKGLPSRRRARSEAPEPHGRMVPLTARRLSNLRKGYLQSHSPQSVKMDVQQQAKVLYDPRYPSQVEAWREQYNHSDLDGVDTVGMELYNIRVEAEKQVQEKKAKVKDAVEDAKKKVKRIAKAKAPPETKKKAVRRVVEAVKTEIKEAASQVREALTKAKGDREELVKRHSEKWAPERKKRANYVAETVGCTSMQADAMIHRADRAGVPYDKVDWDAIQGKDLTYSERVEKLDRTIGKETMTKAEEDRALDWQVDKAEAEFQEYVEKMEAELKEAEDLGAQDHRELSAEEDLQDDQARNEHLWSARERPVEYPEGY